MNPDDPYFQIGARELERMSPAQIDEARAAGRFSELLAGRDPDQRRATEEAVFTPPGIDQGARGPHFANAREWLRSLPPEEIVRLGQEKLTDVLRERS